MCVIMFYMIKSSCACSSFVISVKLKMVVFKTRNFPHFSSLWLLCSMVHLYYVAAYQLWFTCIILEHVSLAVFCPERNFRVIWLGGWFMGVINGWSLFGGLFYDKGPEMWGLLTGKICLQEPVRFARGSWRLLNVISKNLEFEFTGSYGPWNWRPGVWNQFMCWLWLQSQWSVQVQAVL